MVSYRPVLGQYMLFRITFSSPKLGSGKAWDGGYPLYVTAKHQNQDLKLMEAEQVIRRLVCL